ncbi:MAG: YlmC/YmxH family sporulation protein [Firmicutes bacterium]|nr:YlmC/YmxH family sporulation protein [Bacillota bacterium]
MLRTSDLRARDVINVLDGKKLGNVNDLDIDLKTGRIRAIIIPGPPRFFGLFGRDKDYVIPWEKIRKIGIDVILVEARGLTTDPQADD